MTTVIVATDGSDLAIHAGVAGLALTKPADRVLVVAVADVVDPSLAEDATGHASSSMTHEEVEANHRDVRAEGQGAVEATAAALGRVESARDRLELLVIDGEPGPALCDLAAEVGASALIVGSAAGAACGAPSSARCRTTSFGTRPARSSCHTTRNA